MALYVRRPTNVDAEQFTDVDNPPRGIQRTPTPEGGAFFTVTTMLGNRTPVKVGDWIVAESDGVHYLPMTDDEFKRLYDEVES